MDKNLKFAVINNLIRNNIFNFDIDDFFKTTLNIEYDSCAKYNYEPYPEIEHYFVNSDLQQLGASQLQNLYSDAGDDIYHYIWNQWDGEDNYFDICSLDGIEVCYNLTSINLQYISQVHDLSPLGKLQQLQEITIINVQEPSNSTSLDFLTNLDFLKRIELYNFNIDEKSELLKHAKDKGVLITFNQHNL